MPDLSSDSLRVLAEAQRIVNTAADRIEEEHQADDASPLCVTAVTLAALGCLISFALLGGAVSNDLLSVGQGLLAAGLVWFVVIPATLIITAVRSGRPY